jgi:Tfp pilus assembly protein PilX
MKALNKRGVALYFVLATLLVVIILANVILSLIGSQTRLTSHQVKRIQAYYAAQAGVNYALERLRLNATNWVPPAAPSSIARRICGPSYNLSHSSLCSSPNLTESDFPSAIHYVEIFINNTTSDKGIEINATVNYTSLN